MILILEVLLTVAAWKRGWKALALLPISICFLIGVMLAALGADLSLIYTLSFFVDGAAIVVLGIMVAVKSDRKKQIAFMAEEAGKYCPQCGKSNYDNARFCQSCGSDLQVPAQPQTSPVL